MYLAKRKQGNHTYLHLFKSTRVGKKVTRTFIKSFGRLDQLSESELKAIYAEYSKADDDEAAERRENLRNLRENTERAEAETAPGPLNVVPLFRYGHLVLKPLWERVLGLRAKCDYEQTKTETETGTPIGCRVSNAAFFLTALTVLHPDAALRPLACRLEFLGSPIEGVDLQALGHVLAFLAEKKDAILRTAVRSALREETDASEPQDLNGKAHEAPKLLVRALEAEDDTASPIATLVLAVDRRGMPLDFQVVPVNGDENAALASSISGFVTKYGVKTVVVATDSGMVDLSFSDLDLPPESRFDVVVAWDPAGSQAFEPCIGMMTTHFTLPAMKDRVLEELTAHALIGALARILVHCIELELHRRGCDLSPAAISKALREAALVPLYTFGKTGEVLFCHTTAATDVFRAGDLTKEDVWVDDAVKARLDRAAAGRDPLSAVMSALDLRPLGTCNSLEAINKSRKLRMNKQTALGPLGTAVEERLQGAKTEGASER